MKACDTCTNKQTDDCPLYAHRDSEAMGSMITLAIMHGIAEHGKCKFHEGVCNPEPMPSLKVRHCYASAIQGGNRDLFEV